MKAGITVQVSRGAECNTLTKRPKGGRYSADAQSPVHCTDYKVASWFLDSVKAFVSTVLLRKKSIANFKCSKFNLF